MSSKLLPVQVQLLPLLEVLPVHVQSAVWSGNVNYRRHQEVGVLKIVDG